MANAARPRTISLTQREEQVLRYVRTGKPNRAIALEMEIEEITVKTHVSNLLRKFNVESRTQLLLAAQVAFGPVPATPVAS